jgi:hypothetical protein
VGKDHRGGLPADYRRCDGAAEDQRHHVVMADPEGNELNARRPQRHRGRSFPR